jgi:hypothetical protein
LALLLRVRLASSIGLVVEGQAGVLRRRGAILRHVGDGADLRLGPLFAVLQGPEQPGDGQVLFVVQVLIAEQQEGVGFESGADLRVARSRRDPVQVHPVDFHAELLV